MAEPGDPHAPEDPTPPRQDDAVPAPAPTFDADDAVGFTSPAAMEGRPRDTLSLTPPPIDPPVDAPADAPVGAPVAPALAEPAPAPDLPPEPTPDLSPEPVPQWAVETPAAQRPTFDRASAPPAPIEGAMWAYTIYALILFAVPTLGVSAIIGIVAVTGRAAPEDEIARSHYVYQQRTLWAAAVAALLGLILIVVNLGVFVLFALSIWTLVRGFAGVMKLKAGQPIAEPHSWLL